MCLPIAKEGYLQLASRAFGQGKKLFKIRPKLHMLAEIGTQMQELGRENRLALSPIATCTWSDEDYIGRISRVARSTHGATVSVSTMAKTLGWYSIQLQHLATKKRSWRWRTRPGKCWKAPRSVCLGACVCGRDVWWVAMRNEMKRLNSLNSLESENA